MKRAQHRSLVLSAIGLITATAFAGCSGLDDRKVTRGSDDEVAGNGGSGGGNGNGNGGDAETPRGGAPDGQGGDGSPLGGDPSVGGTPTEPSTPPEVIGVDPADGDAEVVPTTNVTLSFSKELDADTVTLKAVEVRDGERPLLGTLSYDKATATFEPSRRLSLLATYDVQVSTALADLAGESLKAPFASQFTVRDGSWTRQASVTTDPGTAGAHASGIDAEGNVLVVYTRSLDSTIPGGPQTVAARWIPVGRTIREEVLLEDNGGSCSGIQVAVDAEGNAFAMWQGEDASGTPVVRGRRYVNGSWERSAQNLVAEGAAPLINSLTSSAVAIGAGTVVAAWVRYFVQGTEPNYAIEYTSTSLEGAWPDRPLTPQVVKNISPQYESLDQVQAAVDAKGNALTTFAWRSSTGAYKGLYFARQAAGMAWDYPVKIPSSNVPAPGQGGPVLVSDGDGAMAVWLDYTNSQYRLLASRYTRARQFAEPVEIGDPRVTAYASLASRGGLATNGKSYWVTWTQSLGNAQNVYVKRYDIASSTWDGPPSVVSDGVARAATATIGVDGHGNAVVTYDQAAVNNTLLVMFARYTATAQRWSDPSPLTDAGTYFEQPLLSVADDGVASVLFSSTKNEVRPASKNTHGSYRIFK